MASSIKRSYSDLDNSDDDDDLNLDLNSDDDELIEDHKREKEEDAKLRRMVVESLRPQELPELSRKEKETKLANIAVPADRSLQKIIWSIGANFTLHKHQFVGVRRIAGVADDFPGNIDNLGAFQSETEDILRRAKDRDEQRGLLVADVMGLGKTVQAVVGCLLRNAIQEAKGKEPKPSLIISPNASVLKQWEAHLIMAGVQEDQIYFFDPSKNKDLKYKTFVLADRYKLQTAVKKSFDAVIHKKQAPSSLFPNTNIELLKFLKNQYRASKHKEANRYIPKDSKISVVEMITRRLSRQHRQAKDEIFRTVIIDEAHFLKNLVTYWGMAACLLGLHSERMVPMTGTPFNNNIQDMASLMAFIDCSSEFAKRGTWEKATEQGKAEIVQREINEWSQTYLLRRGKDVIASQIPKKTVTIEKIQVKATELAVYDAIEASFLKALASLHGVTNPNGRLFEQILKQMLGLAGSMRQALVHQLLPSGGRDLTVFFSPSRNKSKTIIKKQQRKNHCVCCGRTTKLREDKDLIDKMTKEEKKEEKLRKEKNGDAYENLGDSDINDEEDSEDPVVLIDVRLEEYYDDSEEVKRLKRDQVKKFMDAHGTGDMQALPGDMCRLANHGLPHYCCPWCIEKMQENELKCPKCAVLFSRLRYPKVEEVSPDGEEASTEVQVSSEAEPSEDPPEEDYASIKAATPEKVQSSVKAEAVVSGVSLKTGVQSSIKAEAVVSAVSLKTGDEADGALKQKSGRIYCSNIFGGFESSTKLEEVMTAFEEKVPKDDKVLVASFFKGTLDLLEAMLQERHPSLDVARYDGDVRASEREDELYRFKNEPSCRILLMTVQTGGVGLNLTVANHVWFLDRFWNPMVERSCLLCHWSALVFSVHLSYTLLIFTREQCEDRIYRIGQKKESDITYFDIQWTFDVVMASINKVKKTNAGVILADGPALQGGSAFKDLSGSMGSMVHLIREWRVNYIKGAPSDPLPPGEDSFYENNGEDFANMLGLSKKNEQNSPTSVASVKKSEQNSPASVAWIQSNRRSSKPKSRSRSPYPELQITKKLKKETCKKQLEFFDLSQDTDDESSPVPIKVESAADSNVGSKAPAKFKEIENSNGQKVVELLDGDFSDIEVEDAKPPAASRRKSKEEKPPRCNNNNAAKPSSASSPWDDETTAEISKLQAQKKHLNAVIKEATSLAAFSEEAKKELAVRVPELFAINRQIDELMGLGADNTIELDD